MYTIINSQEPLTVVTLDEVKLQCRLMPSFTLDDEYLTSLISVCSELAQTYTRRLLTVGSVSLESDHYNPVVQLPWGGATNITELLLDGVASTNYLFSEITQKVKVGFPYHNIQITYDCGYVDVPAKVKQAVLIMISTMYNHRDEYVTGVTVEKLPTTSQTLLNSVRYYAV